MVRGMEVFKDKTHDDFVKFVQVVTRFLRSLGEMLDAYGDLEHIMIELFGKEAKDIDFLELFESEEVKGLLESADPKLLGKFVVFMFEFMGVIRKIKNIDELTPEEKKEVGTQLKKLAQEFENIMLEGEEYGEHAASS